MVSIEEKPAAAPRAVTLQDVASLAGVNPSTVSRALGKPGRVSAATEERVVAAAEELGYERRRKPHADTAPVVVRPRRVSRSVATIYDVARLAGVNPSTVSRALSIPGRINARTEKRIQDAAKELNYRLNPMARALPTGRTFTIGLLVADITNPMFFNVVRGAEREAADSGYTLILAESQESGQREAETAERLLPSIDGLILATTRLADDRITEFASRKPLVVLNRRLTGVDSVLPDLVPGIDEALAHLASIGHRSIVFLAGPKGSWMSFARWKVLSSRATARGLHIIAIGPGQPTIEGGRSALPKVIASGATAVIAYNDLMAIGLLTSAQESGWTIPAQLSIIGFDDIFGSDFTSPPLTTIRTPLAQLGARAVRRVLDAIEEVETQPGTEPLVTELVIRGSTAWPAATEQA